MITFLLVLNFSLLIVAFLLIILLYLRLNKLDEVERKQSTTINEMENLLTAYLVEMKEENENFLKKIKTTEFLGDDSSNKKNQHQKNDRKINSTKDSPAKIDTKIGVGDPTELLPNYLINEFPKENISAKKGDNNHPMIAILKKESQSKDPYIDSLLAQALLLQKQGMQIEQIAKLLNKGKTEIELLLKFRQN